MRIERRPEWLKKKIDFEKNAPTTLLLNKIGINTVCKEAKCPNISECFKKSHATFMILGKYCTRQCSFCNVEKLKPLSLDPEEPKKVSMAVKKMGLTHVVITSVTRDDLKDGGASIYTKVVRALKLLKPAVSIELLIPDLNGDIKSLTKIINAQPDILGHNIETVPRLYRFRPAADYTRSLNVLRHAKLLNDKIYTKSAIMLGLGEEEKEVTEAMKDLRNVGCDFLALGQYLAPSLKHTKVAAYIPPDRFDYYKKTGLDMGFKHIEAGPYVRSSYLAEEYLK